MSLERIMTKLHIADTTPRDAQHSLEEIRMRTEEMIGLTREMGKTYFIGSSFNCVSIIWVFALNIEYSAKFCFFYRTQITSQTFIVRMC